MPVDVTYAIANYLMQDEKMIRDALLLIRLTYEYEYKHVEDWYGPEEMKEQKYIDAAEKWAHEHSYYEMESQFDINGEDEPSRMWFGPNPPRYDLGYGTPPHDVADWEIIEYELRHYPLGSAASGDFATIKNDA